MRKIKFRIGSKIVAIPSNKTNRGNRARFNSFLRYIEDNPFEYVETMCGFKLTWYQKMFIKCSILVRELKKGYRCRRW